MDKKGYQILRLCFLPLLLLTACVKDKLPANNNTGTPPPSTAGERNVYVACEGSLGNGNSSLYMQNLANFLSYDDVYRSANGLPLGDVFQSMQRIGDHLFLCINNSDKVLVLDAVTRKQTAEIKIPKPRYVLPISSTKAYVSTMFSNKVYIINPTAMTITGTIDMPAQNPEGMMLLGSKAYICTWDTSCNKVYIVNTSNDQLSDSFGLAGYAPQEVFRDFEGTVWVLSGNAHKKKDAALTRLAPGSDIILKELKFAAQQDPVKPVLNAAKDTMYFIGVNYSGGSQYNGIFKMHVNSNTLPSAPFIPAKGFQYFWALAVDPVTNDIFVGDPKGFIQKGSVGVYSPVGELKRTFEVGIGPGHIYFDE